MTTFYLDLENGNDNYGGTSFALLAQGTDGRISNTTFSSVGASFPNDGSLIGQFLSIFNGSSYIPYVIIARTSLTSLTIAAVPNGLPLSNQTVDRQYYIGGRFKTVIGALESAELEPGDSIRVMGSPSPTSLGQVATWTSQSLQPQKVISNSTNTTPISINCSSHGYSTGDIVVINNHSTNTNANGTWEITSTGLNTFTLNGSTGNGVGSGGFVRLRNNTCIRLTSPVTANIASTGPGRTAWVSGSVGNVTTSLNITTTKEHYSSDSIAILASFTTGKAAYWATGALDLSGYQQVSFWIQQTSGVVGAAGAISLCLCSDTTGTTVVNTVNIPNIASTGLWTPITVDLGANLASNIQSIALYVNTDNGAQTFLLSNIIACKASTSSDSLTLTSLIGKNITGETFWAIQSINGTRVMLDNEINSIPSDNSSFNRGYYGLSETVETWKRETIKIGPFSSSLASIINPIVSGREAARIVYSGGWDRQGMTTQSLETWIDGVNGNGQGIYLSNYSWLSFEKFAFTRLYQGIAAYGSSIGNTFDIIAVNNCSNNSDAAASIACQNSQITLGSCVANRGWGLGVSHRTKAILLHGITSNSSGGLYHPSGNCSLKGASLSAKITNNGNYGISMYGAELFVSNLTVGASGISDIYTPSYNLFLKNVSLDSTTELSPIGTGYLYRIYSHNHDQVSGNHKIFTSNALISAATDQRKTASGISWKFQPTNTERDSTFPVELALARVACAANSLVTIKAWMRRDNTGLTMRLVCKGGQIAGVDNDVTSSIVAVNSWEQQTITFTPTEIGVVEITAEAWGGTTYSGWVDDLTISQS